MPNMVQPYLELTGIQKTFGSGLLQTHALGHIDLSVVEGEFLAIVGPSGCGKSTLLQIAAGLTPASAGTVQFNGLLVNEPPSGIVYLFQQYGNSLFPWRTVLNNVAFAVEHKLGMTRALARAHSLRYLEMVGLADFAHRYPWQLSGGMQQRVTIARALAAEPRILLMDEPFSSVDALTRLELHALILDLWTRHRFTAVLVTHDVDEAVFLADRIVVLSSRPSKVSKVIQTELPRPRDSISTSESDRFLSLRHEILSMLLGRSA
jgi:NitT/TauT family transport system ATP-binding protein